MLRRLVRDWSKNNRASSLDFTKLKLWRLDSLETSKWF
jgi:hypothetical protein